MTFWKIVTALVAAGMPLVAQQVDITFEKGADQHVQSYVIGPNGVKDPLTFGSYFANSTEAVMNVPRAKCTMQRGEPVRLWIEKDKQGTLVTYFSDASGKNKQPFTAEGFLAALSNTFNDCNNRKTAPEPAPLPGVVQMYLENGGNGLEAFVMRTNGKKDPLNYGTLVGSVSDLMSPYCPFIQGRTIYLVAEKNDQGQWVCYSVDAYGTKQDASLDHLIVAAAQTLLNCDPSRTVSATAPQGFAIPMRFTMDVGGNLTLVVEDPRYQKIMPLNLGVLLAILVEDLGNCGQTLPDIKISYKKGSGGYQASITDSTGTHQVPDMFQALLNTSANLCATKAQSAGS